MANQAGFSVQDSFNFSHKRPKNFNTQFSIAPMRIFLHKIVENISPQSFFCHQRVNMTELDWRKHQESLQGVWMFSGNQRSFILYVGLINEGVYMMSDIDCIWALSFFKDRKSKGLFICQSRIGGRFISLNWTAVITEGVGYHCKRLFLCWILDGFFSEEWEFCLWDEWQAYIKISLCKSCFFSLDWHAR